MIDFIRKDRYGFEDLVEIVHLLRQPGGCPWDREQTHQSIRRNFLEETYEALEAIDEDSPAHMCEELGDVMLQVVFHSEMEREAGRFTADDVCDGVCKKLILRHPHVFGDVEVSGPGEALDSWDAVKRREKGQERFTDTLEAVARTLPANWRAEKLMKKAGKAGFRWESLDEALQKLSEESAELREAVASGADPAEELGDLLFAAVGVSSCLRADPEEVLQAACDKFIRRFSRMESLAEAKGLALDELPRDQLLCLWAEAKAAEQGA